MAKGIKINKKRRSVRAGKQTPSNVRVVVKTETPPEYSTPVLRLMGLPAYDKVLKQLQRGSSVPSIVSWLVKEGWTGGMTSSTLTQYLYKYKIECAHLIAVKEKDEDYASESYDYYVGSTTPTVDPVQELDKLIAVQKRRVSIDFKTEINISKLLESTHKEVNVLGELLKLRATMVGGQEQQGLSATEGGTLRELQLGEAEQDKMSLLAANLMKEFKGVDKAKAKKTIKAKA